MLPGQLASVYGKCWNSDTDGERYVAATGSIPIGTGSVAPLQMPAKYLGGSSFLYNPVSHRGQLGASAWLRAGQQDIIKAVQGLNNVGLLVRVCGEVTGTASGCFFLDDGSQYHEGDHTKPGIKVELPSGATMPATGSYVAATGISACYKTSPGAAEVFRLLRPRSTGDIVLLRN